MAKNLPARTESARVVGSGALTIACRRLLDSDTPDGYMVANIAPEHEDFEDVLFATEEPSTREWTQHTEKPFPMVYWVAKRVTLTDEANGNPVPVVRITLISPELETVSFASLGILSSLDLIRSVRGDGPYDPAIGLVFKEVKTRRGWKMIRMRPCREAD